MKPCGCSIVGPVCLEGQELFQNVKHAHEGVAGRFPPRSGVVVLARESVWQNYQVWYDRYLAHIGVITWDEWKARHA